MIDNEIDALLGGRHARGYVRPFLWYSNEDASLVCSALEMLKASGIDEVIIENRGGDWFGTERWWGMLDAALAKASGLGMRLWLLDDSHVATGSANDSLRKPENARFRPVNLRLDGMDWHGPHCGGAMRLPNLSEGERLLGVIAFPRDPESGEILPRPMDLSGCVKDDLCMADLPAGLWRIYHVIQAAPEASGFFSYCITMLNRESCRHLIDEVHEKVYEHCGKYFGNAFAGFFSDEPGFGNCNGEYDFECKQNRVGEVHRRLLAWDKGMPGRMAAELGMSEGEAMALLPAVWDDIPGVSSRIRLAYMNVATRLWRENFTGQLGEWCRAHGVEYIGHMLEDDGAHMHMGFGCGHFFRSMAGQDMAGWDIVLGQMIPGCTRLDHFRDGLFYKENFYQYTLPKLAASLAHSTPRMRNRAICEVMGGYGWSAGLSCMKYLFSFCLANGTGNFVPHAFSLIPPLCFKDARKSVHMDMSAAPSGYCLGYLPPTFHACGFNPQYPAIAWMFGYLQRMSALLENGRHVPDVAVYYSAEPDWFHCRASSMDDLAERLTRGGLDFDFLDMDTIADGGTCVSEGRLIRCGERFNALVLPYSERIPRALALRLAELASAGLPLFFVDSLPSMDEFGAPMPQPLRDLARAVPLDGIAEALASCRHVSFDSPQPGIRFYHLDKGNGQGCILFFNEGTAVADVFAGASCLEGRGVLLYDPWRNGIFTPESGPGGLFRLRLAPGQLLAAVYGAAPSLEARPFLYDDGPARTLSLEYDIYIREVTEEDFRLLRARSRPVNLLKEENLTRSCADYRYVAEFQYDEAWNASFLRVPCCGDCARLLLNGSDCGWEAGPSCTFDVRGLLRPGLNRLELYTADSPAYADRFSGTGMAYGTRIPLQPHGIVGDLQLG